MPKYHWTALKVTDILAPGHNRSMRGTVTASSQQAAEKAVKRGLHGRGYDPATGTVEITRM